MILACYSMGMVLTLLACWAMLKDWKHQEGDGFMVAMVALAWPMSWLTFLVVYLFSWLPAEEDDV